MGTIRGGTVPLVVSYRKVTKRPSITRTRNFVGWRKLAANIVLKAIELIEEIAYEVASEVVDAGEQKVVHWALEIDDPWGVSPESSLVAVRVPEKPACGANFEVITIVDQKADDGEQQKPVEPQPTTKSAPKNGSPASVASSRPRAEQDAIRQRFRERIIADGHYDPEAGPPDA